MVGMGSETKRETNLIQLQFNSNSMGGKERMDNEKSAAASSSSSSQPAK